MDEAPSIYSDLIDQRLFRLKKINKIKDYYIAKIHEREVVSKGLSKYIAAFDYFDQALFASSLTGGGVSIASVASFIAAPIGIAGARFYFAFSLTVGILKNY